MKYIIVFLLNYCCFFLQAQVINLDEADLKGAVESVEVRNYRGNEVNGAIQKGDLIHLINYENYDAIFDSSGNVVASMGYDSFSHPWVETKCSYDNKGNLLLRQLRVYKSYGNDYAIEFDSSYYISHYTLHKNGQIAINHTEQFNFINKYKKLVSESYEWYDENQHLDSTLKIRNNNEVYFFTYQTDDEGRITKSSYFYGDTINRSAHAVTRYVYTDSAKIDTVEVVDKEMNMRVIRTFIYNAFNDPIKSTSVHADMDNERKYQDERIREFEYEYDEIGNWTKRIMRYSYGSIIITERVILYYNAQSE